MDVLHVDQDKLIVKKKKFKKMYITCKKRKNRRINVMFCECHIMCVVFGYNVKCLKGQK